MDGTRAVLKNPLLLVGLMLVSLAIKLLTEPDDLGRLISPSLKVEGWACVPAEAAGDTPGGYREPGPWRILAERRGSRQSRYSNTIWKLIAVPVPVSDP